MARQMTEVGHVTPGDTYWSRSAPLPRAADLAALETGFGQSVLEK